MRNWEAEKIPGINLFVIISVDREYIVCNIFGNRPGRFNKEEAERAIKTLDRVHQDEDEKVFLINMYFSIHKTTPSYLTDAAM